MNDVELEKRVIKALLDGHKFVQFIIEAATGGEHDRELRGRIEKTIWKLRDEKRIVGSPQEGWRLP
jgi:hypothetical protein